MESVRHTNYQRDRNSGSPLRLSPRPQDSYQYSPAPNSRGTFNEIINKQDIVPSPAKVYHTYQSNATSNYQSVNNSMYEYRSTVDYQCPTCALHVAKLTELRQELQKYERMYSELQVKYNEYKEKNEYLSGEHQHVQSKVNSLTSKFQKEKSILDEQMRIILKEKYDLEIQLGVARSSLPAAQEIKEYNASAIHILESQLLEERKKVAQQDLRIIELEQLLSRNGPYVQPRRDQPYAHETQHRRTQSSQDYDLPISRPESELPGELSRAQRALKESQKYVESSQLYQPARNVQDRLADYPSHLYTSNQREREESYNKQYDRRYDALYDDNNTEEKLFQRMREKIRSDDIQDSELGDKSRADQSMEQGYQQVRPHPWEDDQGQEDDQHESLQYKQTRKQIREVKDHLEEQERGVSQDNSYEDEIEVEDVSPQRRGSGQGEQPGNSSPLRRDKPDPRDGKNIQESTNGQRLKTTFLDVEKQENRKVSLAEVLKRGGKRSKGVPDKKSKYAMYQDANQPGRRARRGSNDRGRDSSKQSRSRKISQDQHDPNQYSPQFKEQLVRAKKHVRKMSEDQSLSPDQKRFDQERFEAEWQKKKEDLAAKIHSRQNSDRAAPTRLVSNSKTPQSRTNSKTPQSRYSNKTPKDRRHWRKEEPDSYAKSESKTNLQYSASKKKLYVTDAEDPWSEASDSPEKEYQIPKVAIGGTPGRNADESANKGKRVKASVSPVARKRVPQKVRQRPQSSGTQKRARAAPTQTGSKKPHCGICARRYGDEWDTMKDSPNRKPFNC